MSPALQEALNFLKPVADGLIANVEAQVPKLGDEAVQMLENVVAPKFHVPAYVIAIAKSENTSFVQNLDKFAVAELELLKARVDAIL